jgi:sirohydrochlorin cobaltochelatase
MMRIHPDSAALDDLDERLRIILPEQYQSSYEDLQPVPMKSAGLKYAADGSVAWDQVWGSFCDLAMAGGPPHKGALLEPGDADAIDAAPDRYRDVVEEIGRGITMVTDLPADEGDPGWVRVKCFSPEMAAWLLRAIVMENVAARGSAMTLDLPAAPHFRLEKEVKNVITVIAKTCHYWMGHMPRDQKRAIAALFTQLAIESPLLEPARAADENGRADMRTAIAERITQETGLMPSAHRYAGWLGIECPTVAAAIWIMRALVVNNVLSRREGTTLFVPLNPVTDPTGARAIIPLVCVHRLARARGVL